VWKAKHAAKIYGMESKVYNKWKAKYTTNIWGLAIYRGKLGGFVVLGT